ncbi:MAG: type I-U CRISPR-associated protein Csb2, partial [Planctomycetota bacterium]
MSLAIEVRFVTGRYVATAYNDRAKAEWPPHPARLFSALVATWAESEESDPDERTTLVWLEAQGPPAIAASTADAREVVTVFVPVNDAAVTKDVVPMHDELLAAQAEALRSRSEGDIKANVRAEKLVAKSTARLQDAIVSAVGVPTKLTPGTMRDAVQALPDNRVRQPRTFPSVGPVDPVVTFVWSNADPTAPQRRALAELVTRVVRLGHSSSLVAIRLVDAAEVAPTWLPDDEGGEPLRVVRAGQLKALEQAHSLHREQEPRVLPFVIQRYATGQRGAKPSAIQSAFSDNWVVLRRVTGPDLPATAGPALARSLRRALLAHAEEPIPEVLSGHIANGAPSQRDHIAIVPLPFVGHEHASGHILGVALVLPRAAEAPERRAVYRALAAWEDAVRDDDEDTPELPILLGAAGVLKVERAEWGTFARTLRQETWCRAATRWISATPMALDH